VCAGPRRRWARFALGVALFGWATGGVLQVFAGVAAVGVGDPMLVLLLVVPVLLLASRPMALAGEFSAGEPRLGGARLRGWVISPPVGPGLLPILCGVPFFGSVPGWTIGNRVVGGLLPLAVAVAGMLVVAPLVAIQGSWVSLAVGLAVAVGCGAAVGCHPGDRAAVADQTGVDVFPASAAPPLVADTFA
jgi:putative membrane protein